MHANVLCVNVWPAGERAFSIYGGTMLTVSQLASIAARHCTRMADAMIAACVRHALETGEKFDIPEREVMPQRRGKRPQELVDYDRMVRGNRATSASWRR